MQLRGSQLVRGFVIAGYRIDELISRGGMGVVYRATNIGLNRIYALKVLAPELADDPAFRERFKREMRIAASINHPNVVGIHYAGEQDGLVFFVMDFIHGTDLRELIQKSGATEPGRAVELLAQCASALDAAHARGLVHRDVKPANILITVRDGEEHAYLTDFGVAKRSDTAAGLTAQGAVVGTVDYMSPEQITGGHTDARTDIYALGCVFFQMLTGAVPYERENSIAKLFAHVHEEPPVVSGEVALQYPAFGPVLEKAMAKEPADRYLSAGDFARDATAALRGSRFTGPATMVGTGDAMPSDDTAQSDQPLHPGDAALDDTAAQAALPEIDATRPPTPAAPEMGEQDAATRMAEIAGVGESARETSAPSGDAAPPSKTAAPPSETAAPPSETAAPPSQAAPAFEPAPPLAAAAATGSGLGTRSPLEHAGSTGGGGTSDVPDATPSGGGGRRIGLAAVALVAVVGAVVVAVIALGSGTNNASKSSTSGTTTKGGLPFAANAQPVPTNRVTGHGSATVSLSGDQATVNLHTNGLLGGAPHAMHIHAGGKGVCPPASAARLHNGHLAISTTNGISFYGPPQVSLTSHGDTSPHSIVDFSRYPSVGDITYTRTVTVPPGVAAAIRANNAVVVVHGIDYNGNHIYDDVLDRSELKASLPGEATAPALCGHLTTTRTAAVSSRHARPVYVASLHVYDPTPGEEASDFLFLCHLAGIPVPDVAPARTAAADSASGSPA